MKESDPWLAAIVESSDDAIVGKTLQGVIISWNPAAERLFGYAAEEAVGRPIAMLIPPDRKDEEPSILERIGRGEHVRHFETVRLRKDGTPVHVSVSISPVRDPEGRIVGASKIARDIGERKLADTRLRAQLARLHMLDQITRGIKEHQDLRSIHQVTLRSVDERMPLEFACICALGDDGRSLAVSHIGVHSADLARELALAEDGPLPVDANGLSRCIEGRLVYESDTRALQAPFAQRLARAGLRSVVISPLRRDAKVAGLLVAGRREPMAFSSNDCEFLRQLSAHVSLAARHAELHASLQQAYEELRISQQAALRHERLRALGQLASGIAHDINNLVFPAEVLAREVVDETPGLPAAARERLHHVVRALQDVSATVGRLREFYRPRETEQKMMPLSLNPLIRHVIALAQPRCKDLAARGVAVIVRAAVSEPLPPVVGSEAEIREAVLNLVFNAIDAVPQGGTVTVRARAVAASTGADGRMSAELAVEDDGAGMDAETRRRCLDPFFTTKGDLGTGMGLAMVYGTAQRHGADLGIDSAPGRSTTVTLRFPPAPTAAAPAAHESPRSQALRILVIDDDPLVLETLQNMLRATGLDVTQATGGRAGIEIFERHHARQDAFDIVMTDLGMPDVDGHAVARAVKQLSAATPVVLLTGWGEGMERDGSAGRLIDVVLSKPPRLLELREAVARLSAALPRARHATTSSRLP